MDTKTERRRDTPSYSLTEPDWWIPILRGRARSRSGYGLVDPDWWLIRIGWSGLVDPDWWIPILCAGSIPHAGGRPLPVRPAGQRRARGGAGRRRGAASARRLQARRAGRRAAAGAGPERQGTGTLRRAGRPAFPQSQQRRFRGGGRGGTWGAGGRRERAGSVRSGHCVRRRSGGGRRRMRGGNSRRRSGGWRSSFVGVRAPAHFLVEGTNARAWGRAQSQNMLIHG